MKKLLGIVVLGLLLSGNASSDECFEDTLKKNIERGKLLLTTSGKLYQVLPPDYFDSMYWMSYQSLMICPKFKMNDMYGKLIQVFDIININDGKKVTAYPKN
mgnify:CR=1 FL=1